MSMPAAVSLWEAGARDGLQNEAVEVSTAIKIELIERLAGCGLKKIEAASFVSPKWVPRMADSAAVMAGLRREPGVVYQALTPNLRGVAAAVAAKVEHIAVFPAASESFSRRNLNSSIADSMAGIAKVCAEAKARGLRVRGFISTVIGCPFEGAVEPEKVAAIARTLLDLGCSDIGLGDTIGVGTPRQVRKLIEACAEVVPLEKLGVHFHDTYGQALANILMALEMGVAVIDSSVAGLGGCPYAPGATGNVATEDVVYMLDGLGIDNGVDLAELVRTAWWISDRLGRPPVSRVARALKSKCL
ncbi:MAG TPA: hydroxymethylglutaryl-CoA lyase [Candidatus Sulfotelmatobacter sp.]|nr:hydroxymethylglutaryl-CoA lyase [Candidatus Sulfotelmatobacter sp.]